MSRGTALNQRSESSSARVAISRSRGESPRQASSAAVTSTGDERAVSSTTSSRQAHARTGEAPTWTAPHAVALGHVSLLVELAEIHLVRIPLPHGAGPEIIGDGQGEDGGDQRADQKRGAQLPRSRTR